MGEPCPVAAFSRPREVTTFSPFFTYSCHSVSSSVTSSAFLRPRVRLKCSQTWGIFTAFTIETQLIDNVCFGSIGQHGIYVSNSRVSNDNPIIRGNECYGNGQNGIQLNGDCYSGGDGTIEGAIIENNLVHDNNWKGFSLISVNNSIIIIFITDDLFSKNI